MLENFHNTLNYAHTHVNESQNYQNFEQRKSAWPSTDVSWISREVLYLPVNCSMPSSFEKKIGPASHAMNGDGNQQHGLSESRVPKFNNSMVHEHVSYSKKNGASTIFRGRHIQTNAAKQTCQKTLGTSMENRRIPMSQANDTLSTSAVTCSHFQLYL